MISVAGKDRREYFREVRREFGRIHDAFKRLDVAQKVLLPETPDDVELPLFLEGHTWVDLRDGLSDSDLDRLIWGINGEKPN